VIGEAQLLGAQQRASVRRELHAAQLLVHLDDGLEPMQEPAVDAGQVVDLVDGHAVGQRAGDGEHAVGRGVLQALADVALEVARVQAVHADVEHAHGLLDDLGEGAADGHHLADRLHLGADLVDAPLNLPRSQRGNLQTM
jgi:hypothetical protein